MTDEHALQRFPSRHRRLKIWLTVITAVLALVAVSSSILAFTYQRRIIETSRYNSTFDFGQTMNAAPFPSPPVARARTVKVPPT